MSVSLVSADTERAKFQYLLQLAQEQIVALENDDMPTFDRILAAKGTLIAGFPDAGRQVAADPALAGVVRQIQDCDRTAQRLLYAKMGAILRTQAEIRQFKLARRAYAKLPAPGARTPWGRRPEAARFLDQKS